MAYLQGCFPVLRKEILAEGIYDMTVHCPPIAEQAKPGQFVHIRVAGFTLRRPISICAFDPVEGWLRLVFEVRGEGTQALAALEPGSEMDLLGPLGNGFRELSRESRIIVVGGGIGVPPLLQTAAQYGGNATAILGFRTKNACILTEDFKKAGCDTRFATDDGTAGFHGFVTGLLEQRLAEGGAKLICACGPMGMLKAVTELAQKAGVACQVSLEERMGCGVGACLVCACKTVRDGKELYSHVCKDGPVFDSGEVVFS